MLVALYVLQARELRQLLLKHGPDHGLQERDVEQIMLHITTSTSAEYAPTFARNPMLLLEALPAAVQAAQGNMEVVATKLKEACAGGG
jgi:hypothetical protein